MGVTGTRNKKSGPEAYANMLVPRKRDAKDMPKPIGSTLGKMFSMTSKLGGFELPGRVDLLRGGSK